MKIADQMFRETCSYYKENGEMPTEEAAREITERIYKKAGITGGMGSL